MIVSPLITETYAFYYLFYGNNGVIRKNDTETNSTITIMGPASGDIDTIAD